MPCATVSIACRINDHMAATALPPALPFRPGATPTSGRTLSELATRSAIFKHSSGPLSTLEGYAEQGEDLFGAFEQFRAWLSCRRPFCTFDILVLRYDTLSESTEALFDFLMLPEAVRKSFPGVRQRRASHSDDLDPPVARKLDQVYETLDKAISAIPPQGMLLKNT